MKKAMQIGSTVQVGSGMPLGHLPHADTHVGASRILAGAADAAQDLESGTQTKLREQLRLAQSPPELYGVVSWEV
jgi:hypothetical protein